MAAVGFSVRAIERRDWEWIKLRASPVLCEDTDGIVAERDGELVAAAVFDSFSENSCLSHIVIEDPFVLRHHFLNFAFQLAFTAKGVGVVTGLTPADNKEALRFNRKIGMREVYRIRDGYKKGVDFVLQEMREEECRWLAPFKLRAA